MRAHGTFDYCPHCDHEIHSNMEPCPYCGYDGRLVRIHLTMKQLDMLLSNRIDQMRPIINFISKNVVEVE